MSEPASTVESQNLHLAHEVLRAWNDHDPDRYAALLADDFVAEVQGCSSLVRGGDDARKLMQSWFNAFPNLRFALKATATSGELVLSTWQATGTLRHQYSSPPVGNQRLEAHGCTLVTLRHGTIARAWTYWDSDALLKHVEESFKHGPLNQDRSARRLLLPRWWSAVPPFPIRQLRQ